MNYFDVEFQQMHETVNADISSKMRHSTHTGHHLCTRAQFTYNTHLFHTKIWPMGHARSPLYRVENETKERRIYVIQNDESLMKNTIRIRNESFPAILINRCLPREHLIYFLSRLYSNPTIATHAINLTPISWRSPLLFSTR